MLSMNSNGKQTPMRANCIKTITSHLTTAQSDSIYIAKATETVTMGCHDPRLVGGICNKEEGTRGSCFYTGRLRTVSPEGNLSEFGNKLMCNQIEERVIELVN